MAKSSWTKEYYAWSMEIVDKRRCPQCKKMFGIRQGNRRQKFCSQPCVINKNKKNKKTRPCPICKKAFTVRKKTQQTCSLSCAGIHRGRKAKRKYVKEKEKVPRNIRMEYCHQEWLECANYSSCGGSLYKEGC